MGDYDGDGTFEKLYALGAPVDSRSGAPTASGTGTARRELETITAAALPTAFNSDNAANASFDTRSDNKGPEPEGVTVGKLFGGLYAFVALERIGGVIVLRGHRPPAPALRRPTSTIATSPPPIRAWPATLGPRGCCSIPAEDSPNGQPLLVVSNEISGSTSVLEISKAVAE